MAIYHLTAKPISRSTGRSAVAAASYQSGTAMHDERTGRSFNYTKKRGVVHAEIVAPANAPAWCKDRAQLWNRAEAAEKRKDAQTARSIEMSLPKEIPPHLHAQIVREFCQDQFVKKGMIADFAIHANQGNPHAHIMLTMRPLAGQEFSQKKDRTWNDKKTLEGWREGWQDHANRWLEKVGSKERIDHRSYKERGIARTPSIHEGPVANAVAWRTRKDLSERHKQNVHIKYDNIARERDIIAARKDLKTAQEEIRFNRFAVAWPTFLKTIDRAGPAPVQTAIARAKAKGQEPTKTERAQIAKRVREQFAQDADLPTSDLLFKIEREGKGKTLTEYTKAIEKKARSAQRPFSWTWLMTGKEKKAEIIEEAQQCRAVLDRREGMVKKEISEAVQEAARWKEIAEAVSGVELETVQYNYDQQLSFEKDQEEARETAREAEREAERAERAKHPEREHERELGDDWGPSL